MPRLLTPNYQTFVVNQVGTAFENGITDRRGGSDLAYHRRGFEIAHHVVRANHTGVGDSARFERTGYPSYSSEHLSVSVGQEAAHFLYPQAVGRQVVRGLSEAPSGTYSRFRSPSLRSGSEA